MNVRSAIFRLVLGASLATLIVFGSVPSVVAQSDTPLIIIPLEEIDDADAADNPDAFSHSRLYFNRGGSAVEPLTPPEPAVLPLRLARPGVVAPEGMLRITGEQDELGFFLFVSEPEAAEVLRISTLSSINVLPERSSLRVFVNGEMLGEAALENFSEFGFAEFDLPPALLERGRNRVRVQVEQYHRIFCGPEASFALWSDLDLANSGVVLAQNFSRPPSADAFLEGLAAEAGLGRAIEIRAATELGPGWESWLGRLTTRLSNALSGSPLSFSFSDYWTLASDIAPRARITFLPGEEGRVSFRTGGDGAVVMVIEHAPGQALSDGPDLDGLVPVPEATTALGTVRPGEEVAFADFGFETLRIGQRYFNRDYSFHLPEDWVILTAAKARIRMDYAYAEGLPEGSMLLLHVNGETIRLLPLKSEGGRLITRFPVDFEARLLRAGANTLTLEMLVPGEPPDLPCAGHGGPVLEVRASSTINVPESPSMFLPDLTLAFSRLDGSSLRLAETSARSFTREEMMTLGAALNRLGAPGARRNPPRLHLVALDDLGSVPLGDMRVSRRVMEDVLLLDQIDDTAPLSEATTSQMDEDDLFYRAATRRESSFDLGAVRVAVRAFVDRVLFWVHPQSGTRLGTWLEGQRGSAMLVQLDYAQPNDLWLVRGRDADIAEVSAALLRARTTGIGPHGQVSVLGHDGGWHNWTAPDRRPVLTEPLSLANIRVVIGNFASAIPSYFVAAFMALGILSAFVALRLIISTREES